MNNYHGDGRRKEFFEGWYLKHQKGSMVLGVIIAVHRDRQGKMTGSVQVITGDKAFDTNFSMKEIRMGKKKFWVRMGRNYVSEKGMHLNLELDGVQISGTIKYGKFKEPETDVMGPLRYIPFLQCNHGVLSMTHRLLGKLYVNGEPWDFTGGTGYIEKDWGCSFPERYLWAQCNWKGNGVMAAFASIPFCWISLPGCVVNILYEGRQYRLASYLGGRVAAYDRRSAVFIQGNKKLVVRLLSGRAFKLKAPNKGCMDRRIKEILAGRVRFQFFQNGKCIFDVINHEAGFEIDG